MIKRVKPYYRDDWLKSLKTYIENYDFWHDGIIEMLEIEIKKIIDRKYALAVNSSSNAIFMSLYIWHKKHPDRNQVILPNWGYPAAFKACKVLGLTPIPVDMDKRNLSMALDEVYLNLKNETLAVIHIENNGVIGNAEIIKDMITDAHVLYIEDSAPSLLQENAGLYGDVAMFSFSPTKPLMAGEGSVIVMDDEELYESLKQLRHTPNYGDKEPSLNFMLSPFLAAYLLPQFDSLTATSMMREAYHSWYKRNLNIFEEEKTNRHGAIMYLSPNAEKISKKLNQFGIEHRYKYYPCYSEDRKWYPISHEIRDQIIDLPMHHDLGHEKVKTICDLIKRIEDA